MKLINTAKTKNNVELIVGLVMFMFLLSGCVTTRGHAAYALKCQDAEKAVSQAEKEFVDAARELALGNKDEKTIVSISKKMQNLDNAQERAFQACYRVESN